MTTDWIPFELMRAGTRSMVRWIHPGSEPLFAEPFFRLSIQTLISAHAVQKLTPVEELLALRPLKAPQGFIFHVSRCGSTLVSRSLATLPRLRVISEAGPVNQLLLTADLDQGRKRQLLRGLIHALCGTAPHTACIIKFTSWNLLFLEQLRALFPDTPWIFLYREPEEVLQSLLASAPNWATHQQLTQLPGKPEAAAVAHLLSVLERSFAAPLPHLDRMGRAFNYAQLPAAIPAIAQHFGLELDTAEQAQVLVMGQYDAKQPGDIRFVARAREPIPQALKGALSPLHALYQKWEQLRIDHT